MYGTKSVQEVLEGGREAVVSLDLRCEKSVSANFGLESKISEQSRY